MIAIDIWALFVSLLTVALLQEFLIKPGVEIIKKYYHKSKSHMKNLIDGYPYNEK